MRIRLSTLFLAMLVVATTMSLVGAYGVPCSACVLLSILAIVRRSRALAGIVVVLFVVTSFPHSLSLREKVRSEARLCVCSNRLKEIAVALRRYRADYGCFPPPYLTDQNGKPIHSWRVLLLPYLGEMALYRQYRFDEPWDGPNNRQLANKLLGDYACICQPNPGGKMTSYVAIVGPHTLWAQSMESNGDKGRARVGDRLLVAEVADSQINWMEPRDLTLEQATGDNGESSPAISSYHGVQGICVALADGSTCVLPATISGKTLHKLCTEGLAATPIEELASPPDYLEWRVAAWLVSIVVLLVHAVKDTRAVSNQLGATT